MFDIETGQANKGFPYRKSAESGHLLGRGSCPLGALVLCKRFIVHNLQRLQTFCFGLEAPFKICTCCTLHARISLLSGELSEELVSVRI